IARPGKQHNGSGSRVLAKYKRIDSDGRRRIRQAAYGLLAGGAPASGNLRGDQRILERSGYVFAGLDRGGPAEGWKTWGCATVDGTKYRADSVRSFRSERIGIAAQKISQTAARDSAGGLDSGGAVAGGRILAADRGAGAGAPGGAASGAGRLPRPP